MIKMLLIVLPIIFYHLILLGLLEFTAWPEMLSYPYLLSNGFQIYKDAVIPYPPLLPIILSLLFNLFGYDPQTLRWFSWLLIVIVDLNLFILTKMISKSSRSAVFLVGTFVILQSLLDGNMLWFDGATVVPLSIGLIFFWKWIEKRNLKALLLTVLFLTIGTTIKQTAVIYFLPVIAGYLLIRKQIIFKEITYSVAAFLTIWLPIVGYLFANNLTQSFWLWNFIYPLTEWSKFPGYVDLILSRRQLIIMILLLIPLSMSLVRVESLIKDKIFWILSLLLFSALLTVYPRFSFFHLQPALYCLIILLAYISTVLKEKQKLFLAGLIIICILPIINFQFSSAFAPLTIRFAEPADIYLSQQIKLLNSDNKKIYLLGPTSSQYVFSQTLPAKPWMDSFGWYLEIPTVQDQVIDGLKNEQPQIILWQQPQSGQWYELGAYQPKKIVSFIQQSYVQINTLENGVTVWTKKD